MQYIIESKKNISNFYNTLKQSLLIQTQPTLILNQDGWIMLQNGDQIDNIDNKELIFLAQFQHSFFSSIVCPQDPETKNQLNQGEISFEFETQNLFKLLKSVRFSLKKLVFQINPAPQGQNILNPSNRQLRFSIFINTEDGQFQIEKEFYNNPEIANRYQMYKELFLDFDQDKSLYMQVNAKYFKQLKDMRNYCTEFKYNSEFLNITCLNQTLEQEINISKEVFDIYNYEGYSNVVNGSLLVPPNYLDPHIFLSSKVSSKSIGLYIQTGPYNNNDNFIVYAKSKADNIQFFHSFISASQEYEKKTNNLFPNPNIVANKQNNLQQQQQNIQMMDNCNNMINNQQPSAQAINSDMNVFDNSDDNSQDHNNNINNNKSTSSNDAIEVENCMPQNVHPSKSQRHKQKQQKQTFKVPLPTGKQTRKKLDFNFQPNQQQQQQCQQTNYANNNSFNFPPNNQLQQNQQNLDSSVCYSEDSNIINSFHSSRVQTPIVNNNRPQISMQQMYEQSRKNQQNSLLKFLNEQRNNQYQSSNNQNNQSIFVNKNAQYNQYKNNYPNINNYHNHPGIRMNSYNSMNNSNTFYNQNKHMINNNNNKQQQRKSHIKF